MRMIFLIIFFLLILENAITQDHQVSIGTNYRLYPSNVNQTEVFIVKSPLNDNILFSSCNTLTFIPFFISEGIYITADGGTSWQGSDTCSGAPIDFHGGDPGITIDKNGTFILTRLGRSPFTGLFSHYSTDNGLTWSEQKVISTDDLERATLASDVNPLSPYYGRTYATWVKFGLPYPLVFAYTDDGAKSWSEPMAVNNPPNRSAGGDVAIGPNGEIYTCWAGVTEQSPFKEIRVGFAASLNGGADWNVQENAFEMNGITGVLANKANIRVNGLPNIAVDTTNGLRRGWIYIISGQKDLAPAGSDPDIILNRSTDGGYTWSEGIRVNQDALNNGKTQYFPGIDIDRFGAVNIIFYDDRNTTNDSTGVFLARSQDGGDTWTEFEISDHNYKPVPIGGLGQGYQGDNIDITSTDSKLWPVWMDNATGIYQVWTTPINFSSINEVGEESNSGTELSSIYPNPFSSRVKIAFHVSERCFVSLKIYDMMGAQIAELVNDMKSPGDYEVEYHLRGNVGSGIYFCELKAGNILNLKRILLIK